MSLWAGVVPLLLAFAAAAAQATLPHARDPVTGFAYYGNVFFDWLANVAVPLAVLITVLLAMTLGYRYLIGKIVTLVTQRN